MSISIHTRSVSMAKGGAHKFGFGLAKHVSRDEQNATEVKNDTDSFINPNLTKYNVNLVDDYVGNFNKADELIALRNQERNDKLLPQFEAIKPQYQELNKTKRKLKKELKSFPKSSQKTPEFKKVKSEYDSVMDQLEPMQQIKDQYKKWNKSTAVAGISTIQLSNDTLAKLGWQFHDDGSAFNSSEQIEFDKQNSTKSFGAVREAYKYAFDGVKAHPERYGVPISASVHFDESTPHLDLFTLNIGQNLDGSFESKHIGDKDNGTNNERLNIRQRTYTNGRNNSGLNKHWKQKAQDDLELDFQNAMASKYPGQPGLKSKFTEFGFTRGDSINDSAHKFKKGLEKSRNKASYADSVVDSANSYASSINSSATSLRNSMARYKSSLEASLNESVQGSVKAVQSSIANEQKSVAIASTSLANLSSAVASQSMITKSKMNSVASYADSTVASADYYSDSLTGSADQYLANQTNKANIIKRAVFKLLAVGIRLMTNTSKDEALKLATGQKIYENSNLDYNGKSYMEIGFMNFQLALDRSSPNGKSKFYNKLNNDLQSDKSNHKNDDLEL